MKSKTERERKRTERDEDRHSKCDTTSEKGAEKEATTLDLENTILKVHTADICWKAHRRTFFILPLMGTD